MFGEGGEAIFSILTDKTEKMTLARPVMAFEENACSLVFLQALGEIFENEAKVFGQNKGLEGFLPTLEIT
jgi:hypothetical protein